VDGTREGGLTDGVEPVLMSISVGSGMPKPPVYISIRATAIRRSPAGSVRRGKTHAFDPDSDDSRQQEFAGILCALPRAGRGGMPASPAWFISARAVRRPVSTAWI
jgi:hypothetical protein